MRLQTWDCRMPKIGKRFKWSSCLKPTETIWQHKISVRTIFWTWDLASKNMFVVNMYLLKDFWDLFIALQNHNCKHVIQCLKVWNFLFGLACKKKIQMELYSFFFSVPKINWKIIEYYCSLVFEANIINPDKLSTVDVRVKRTLFIQYFKQDIISFSLDVSWSHHFTRLQEVYAKISLFWM